MIELERLLTALDKRFPPSRGVEAVSSDSLRQILHEAIHPLNVSQEFPRMLYKDSSNRLVANRKEESAALREGWSRDRPVPDPNFPKWFCERGPSEGGWKRFDLRRVQLNSAGEYEQWKAVVEEADWIEDQVVSIWGGRGISLGDLITEKRASLKAKIDVEDLVASHAAGTASTADADGGAPPDSAVVSSATHASKE
jgi:hypothetical protein